METNEAGRVAQAADGAEGTAVPPLPALRRGDERRIADARPELCGYCQRNPRPPQSRGGGRRPAYCVTEWGQDSLGREITCARLDLAHDVLVSVYGGTGPLDQLDLGVQAHRLAELQATLAPVAAELIAMQASVERVQQALAGEVTAAREAQARAEAEAFYARRDTEEAMQSRDIALAERRAAEQRCEDSARDATQARVDRDDARAAVVRAEDREREANARAKAATAAAREAHANLAELMRSARTSELTAPLSPVARLAEREQQLIPGTAIPPGEDAVPASAAPSAEQPQHQPVEARTEDPVATLAAPALSHVPDLLGDALVRPVPDVNGTIEGLLTPALIPAIVSALRTSWSMRQDVPWTVIAHYMPEGSVRSREQLRAVLAELTAPATIEQRQIDRLWCYDRVDLWVAVNTWYWSQGAEIPVNMWLSYMDISRLMVLLPGFVDTLDPAALPPNQAALKQLLRSQGVRPGAELPTLSRLTPHLEIIRDWLTPTVRKRLMHMPS
ncbi:hypothetical protein GCM10022247_35830 [Allokutzneria multivorans]|uniref:Uncharacterized protein n=1 Tax=Allokutzneria multivorans TaxID=1142134 RepID=A0ABP7SDY0_9PSEU